MPAVSSLVILSAKAAHDPGIDPERARSRTGRKSRARAQLVTLPRRAPWYAEILKFLGKILTLQIVDNFIRANGYAHIGPILMASRRHHEIDLPSGKILDEILKRTHHRRSQKPQIIDEHDNLRIFGIITVHRIVAPRLSRQIVRPPEALEQFIDCS